MKTAMAANPFDRYKGVGKPEEKKEAAPTDSKLEATLRRFEEDLEFEFPERLRQILTPEEINQFLQNTIQYESHENYSAVTGSFISELIQNSYAAGHNKFTLNTRSLAQPLNWLGQFLKGEENSPIEVIVDGDVGEYCGDSSKHVVFDIRGNAGGLFGQFAQYSSFTVHGSVNGKVAEGAEKSTFHLHGDFSFPNWPPPSRTTLTAYSKDGYRKAHERLPRQWLLTRIIYWPAKLLIGLVYRNKIKFVKKNV